MNVLNADINGKYTVISLFAGCGGSSLGYKMAGYKELLVVDFNKNAVETFKLNFPEIPIWQKDITKITGQAILEFCNIKRGELDVLDGSPPCQGFSTAGKRKVMDSRNDLVNEYIRLVSEIEPKVFIMENVSGMVKGTMKGLFIEYLKKMKALNYNVKVKLLNAKYYNVPQNRQRLIFIGVRKDLNKMPVFPMGNKKLITIKEALKNITPIKRISPCKGQMWAIKQCKPGENLSKYHKKKWWFSYARLPANKPSFCIQTCQAFKVYHYKENRCIDINELLILFSFPHDFKMKGNYNEQWSSIGNSVPPLFMKAIAENIKTNILD